MVNHIAITKARINLGSLVKRAHLNGEYFILEKDGIPIAGIMNADEMEDYLDIHDPETIKEIQASKKDYEAGRFQDAFKLLDELKNERVIKEKMTKTSHKK